MGGEEKGERTRAECVCYNTSTSTPSTPTHSTLSPSPPTHITLTGRAVSWLKDTSKVTKSVQVPVAKGNKGEGRWRGRREVGCRGRREEVRWRGGGRGRGGGEEGGGEVEGRRKERG